MQLSKAKQGYSGVKPARVLIRGDFRHWKHASLLWASWRAPSRHGLCYALLHRPSFASMAERKHLKTGWMDLVWLLFLMGLAVLPPIDEPHKQFTLLAIAVLQLFEGKLAALFPRRGWGYVVL